MGIEVSSILIMLFITIYVGIINIFSILFRMTGLTKEKSKFQTITLFTAVGFTTSESEIITSDRTRRKIATACMIVGNFFSVIIVSLIVNLISNFSVDESKDVFIVIGIAFGVFVLLLVLMQIPPIKRALSKVIEKIALKSFGKDKTENFLTLLDNYGDNAIEEIYINRLPHMLEGISIAKSGLKQVYGINLLMIKRKDHVIEVTPDTMIQKNDCIVVFGKSSKIKEVFSPKFAALTDDKKDSDNVLELLDNFSSEAMVKITLHTIPAAFAGKRLTDLRLKALYGLNIVILKRNNELITVNAHTHLEQEDELIVFGPFNNIHYLFAENDKAAVNIVMPDVQKEETGIYTECPSFENDELLLRQLKDTDNEQLMAVYSDEKAFPFFNLDELTKDNRQYTTIERMNQAIEFWNYSYQNKWSVRWTILDKKSNCAIGTVEVQKHLAKDAFHNSAVVTLDLRSDFETKQTISEILSLLENACFELFDCDKIATKGFEDSTERKTALEEAGFTESLQPFVAISGNYKGYWVKKKPQ